MDTEEDVTFRSMAGELEEVDRAEVDARRSDVVGRIRSLEAADAMFSTPGWHLVKVQLEADRDTALGVLASDEEKIAKIGRARGRIDVIGYVLETLPRQVESDLDRLREELAGMDRPGTDEEEDDDGLG